MRVDGRFEDRASSRVVPANQHGRARHSAQHRLRWRRGNFMQAPASRIGHGAARSPVPHRRVDAGVRQAIGDQIVGNIDELALTELGECQNLVIVGAAVDGDPLGPFRSASSALERTTIDSDG